MTAENEHEAGYQPRRARTRIPIRVGASYRSGTEPEPEHFHVGSVTYDVVEIVDRWYQGPRRAGDSIVQYYKVRSRGGSVFLIAFDQSMHAWFLIQSFGPESPL